MKKKVLLLCSTLVLVLTLITVMSASVSAEFYPVNSETLTLRAAGGTGLSVFGDKVIFNLADNAGSPAYWSNAQMMGCNDDIKDGFAVRITDIEWDSANNNAIAIIYGNTAFMGTNAIENNNGNNVVLLIRKDGSVVLWGNGFNSNHVWGKWTPIYAEKAGAFTAGATELTYKMVPNANNTAYKFYVNDTLIYEYNVATAAATSSMYHSKSIFANPDKPCNFGFQVFDGTGNADTGFYTKPKGTLSFRIAMIDSVGEGVEIANGICGDDLTWTLDSHGKLVISGTGEMYDYSVSCPWDDYKGQIMSVVVEDGVTSIGDCAFAFCRALTGVTMGDTVTSIGEYSFYICQSLTDITIPDSVTSIGDYAFLGCVSLKSIILSDDLVDIGFYSFGDCSGLLSITIPDSVTSIGDYAFDSCDNLTLYVYENSTAHTYAEENSIDYELIEIYSGTCGADGDNLTWTFDTSTGELVISGEGQMKNYYSSSYLPWYEFLGDIKSVKIGDGVTSIGNYAFYNCTSLTSITIPDSVTSIGDSAFSNCTSLTSITIPDSVTSIGRSAFERCERIASITIPENVSYIGMDAFSGCTSVEKIYFNAKYVSSTNGFIFDDSGSNDGITVIIGKNVSTIPANLFDGGYQGSLSENSTKIINVIFAGESSCMSIGAYAFRNCEYLTNITIPDSVTSIGSYAFLGCTSLQYNIYDNGKYLGNSNNPYLYLATPVSVSITECNIHPSTKILGSAFSDCRNLTSITIPDSVTSISDSAFFECTSLTSITIPDSVTSIGSYAFAYCRRLTSITIPDSVTSIGHGTFEGCTSLTSVTIPDSVTSIGSYAFSDCRNLTSITIPDSVTSIGSYAFYNCTSLTSVTIGNGVTSIGDGTFYNCTSLTSVYYCGTVEEWNSIEIGYSNYSLTGATRYYHKCNWVIVTPAGCTNGLEIGTCEICKEDFSREIQGSGHRFSYWTVMVSHTCTTSGLERRVCSICNVQEHRAVAAQHSDVFYSGKAPTCTESGWSDYAICSKCGRSTYEEIAALGGEHSYSNWKILLYPTVTTDGFKSRVCDRCQHEEFDIVAYIYGDANGDGVITNVDITIMVRYLCGWGIGGPGISVNRFDATRDGKINNRDVIAVIWMLIGKNDCVTLGHKWNDATCQTPKTCSACLVTDGGKLEHVLDGGTVCKGCGQVVAIAPENFNADVSYACAVDVGQRGEYDGQVHELYALTYLEKNNWCSTQQGYEKTSPDDDWPQITQINGTYYVPSIWNYQSSGLNGEWSYEIVESEIVISADIDYKKENRAIINCQLLSNGALKVVSVSGFDIPKETGIKVGTIFYPVAS